MRRVARYVLTGLAVLSMAAYVAVCILWAENAPRREKLLALDSRLSPGFHCRWDGGLRLEWNELPREALYVNGPLSCFSGESATFLQVDGPRKEMKRWWDTGVHGTSGFAGVEWAWGHWMICLRTSAADDAAFAYDCGIARRLFIHPWAILLALALLPTLRGASWLFRRPISQGRCDRCAYDLHATPDRCPECGTIPKSS